MNNRLLAKICLRGKGVRKGLGLKYPLELYISQQLYYLRNGD